MAESSRTFIGVDWRNLEGRLTAYFSGDTVLRTALEQELQGGPKVHSVNAAIIYGIDPADAMTHMVDLQGTLRPAYVAGKRLTHAWNYGMDVGEMARQYWISKDEARRIIDVLSDAYQGVVAWRRQLADFVFGIPQYKCLRCGYEGTADEIPRGSLPCPMCKDSTPSWMTPPLLRHIGNLREPARILYTPFQRRRIYMGRRGQSENALYAQLPQSTGASMWYRTLDTLVETIENPGDLFVPDLTSYSKDQPAVYTGTYDSFLIGVRSTHVERLVPVVRTVLEWSWEELPLYTPCEDHRAEYWMRESCNSCEKYTDPTGRSNFYCPTDVEIGDSWGDLQ